MPVRPRPVPAPLDSAPFSTAEGLAAGLSPSRLRGRDLTSPFVGTRTAGAIATDHRALLREYLPRMVDGEFFSHVSAALLHGMWLPLALVLRLEIHVAVHKPQRAPRDRRVRGHHLIPRPDVVTRVDGLPVAGRIETWCQLATVLTLEDLVVAGDSLVAHGVEGARGVLSELRAAAQDEHRPRAKLLAEAASMLRCGHRSAGESRTRFVLLSAGLPECEINAPVTDEHGRFVAEVDLLHRPRRLAVEYEGDGHRTDVRQFRKDLNRYELLQDLAWRVVRVTADDLGPRRPQFVRRMTHLFGH